MRMPRTLWDLEDWLGNRNYYSDVKCSSRPRATALVRLSTSSLRKMLWTYHLTVLVAMNSRAAISRFEKPSPISASTSRSRLVRCRAAVGPSLGNVAQVLVARCPYVATRTLPAAVARSRGKRAALHYALLCVHPLRNSRKQGRHRCSFVYKDADVALGFGDGQGLALTRQMPARFPPRVQ